MSHRSRCTAWLANLGAGLVITAAALAVLRSPPVPASGGTGVTIDQAPLTVQQSLPPNITLMLDDSGSMAWNFMPDICYLNGVSCSSGGSINAKPNNDALINAANNGVYYNPAITYTPPPRADGTSYPNSPSITGAYINGFTNTGTVDITNYATNVSYNSSDRSYAGAYEGYTPGSGLTTGKSNIAFSYVETPDVQTETTTQSNSTACSNLHKNVSGWAYVSYGTLSRSCVWSYQAPDRSFFQFSTGAKAGPYTVRYVASSDCYSRANCVLASDTSGVAAPAGVAAGQNIANWFSYYRSRLLMAKSGLMNAFATLDPTIRFGFGSLDGGNSGNNNYTRLPTASYSYSDAYNGGSNYIAEVRPFGANNTTHKNQFWTWLNGATASGGTPLRQALSAVGQYYQTAQPWQTSTADTTELACRQSYTILTTDGFWNESNFSVPTELYGSNVDAPSRQVQSIDSRTPVCASGYTLNASAGDPGRCARITTSAPSCSSSPWTSRINDNSTDVACAANPTTRVPTCSNSGVYNSANGTCSRGSVRCNTSPYTTLTGSGSGQACVASPVTRTPTCSSGTLNAGSAYPGLCYSAQIATPTCPSASNPSTPAYTLTNANTLNASCQRTITTTESKVITNTGPNGQTYTYDADARPLKPYADTYANTLADVAMYYWLTDLRGAVDNEVPTSTEDPAFWQHMTTFTLGLGFTPTGITPSGTTIDQVFRWANGGAPIANFSWPQPSSDSINNITDLAHAAVNGHGGFYSATSPTDFSNALVDALKRVNERIGSGASLAANSTKLDTGTVTYQAVYYTGKWKGDLKAFTVNPSNGVIATTPSWVASNVMPSAANRTIRTYNPGATGDRMVAFSSTSTLSTAQRTALFTDNNAATDDTAQQQAIINYLRGDASGEEKNGGRFRNRDTALGDIVNSQPLYIGAPNANLFFGKTFTGSSSYATFSADKVNRAARIWVAANDGMLHAFNTKARSSGYDTSTSPSSGSYEPDLGEETFAYLPNAVILAGVANLADTRYGNNALPHAYFNDGEITVADVYYASAWHTVLVGTSGRGTARAVYALDVTDSAAPRLLWERSAGDGLGNSNYIGQIVGKPIVAQTADGTWSVLLGNGYNSAANTAALLQFAVTDGALTVRTAGSDTDNGLAAPAVWMDDPTNGVSTKAYAGDLKGKVWAFNLNQTSGSVLFSAVNSGGTAQPITGGMLAGKDPKTGNVWLFFGTGRYLAQSELADTSVQSWYGLIAQSGPGQPGSLVSNLGNGRSALVQRQILYEAAATSSSLAARAISSASGNDMSGKSGWYIDLKPPSGSGRGERMVTPNQFQGTLLLGTSRIPESSDPCNPSGSGWIMAIEPFTGTAPGSTFFDINHDTLFNNSDKITDANGNVHIVAGVGFSSIPTNPIFAGNTMLVSFDNAATGNVNTKGTVGAVQRLSWREWVVQ